MTTTLTIGKLHMTTVWVRADGNSEKQKLQNHGEYELLNNMHIFSPYIYS